MDCIFCKIANKEIPSDVVYEDQEILGFKNIEPEAPVHLLLIPKKHLEWKDNLGESDFQLLGRLLAIAKDTAQKQNIAPACKLIFNIGKTGHIAHVHLHLIGGWTGKIPLGNVAED
jgi:histidine triad (HIT) family protein